MQFQIVAVSMTAGSVSATRADSDGLGRMALEVFALP